jgi:hypothetical protein
MTRECKKRDSLRESFFPFEVEVEVEESAEFRFFFFRSSFLY